MSLTQKIKNEKISYFLRIFSSLELRTDLLDRPSTESTLELRWPKTPEFDLDVLQSLLEERCAFSSISIECDSIALQASFPMTDGETRSEGFIDNQVVA